MTSTLCVLGLGYIGLPTAALFARAGHRVLGVDVNPHVVATLNSGAIHLEEPGLAEVVAAAVASGHLRASTAPAPADVFLIAVPTPLTADKRADLSYVESATRAILPHVRAGNLVILESTSPPGTTRDLVAPILRESGLDPDRDLHVVHCPERVLPGRILHELVHNDRVVGGLGTAAAERAQDFYKAFVQGRILLTDATTAEMVKVMENTYRDVNIALANELAVVCGKLGIDAWEVVGLANHHPRVHLHNPGPGVGGHCISVDPWFLVDRLPADTPLIHRARELNDQMPHRVAALVRRHLAAPAGGRAPRVVVLGVTYKGGVDDVRESPAFEVLHDLTAAGVEVRVHDPHVQKFPYPLHALDEAFRGADAALLLADHPEFRKLDPRVLGPLMDRRLVIDTRRWLDLPAWQAAGFETLLLGQAPLDLEAAVGVAQAT